MMKQALLLAICLLEKSVGYHVTTPHLRPRSSVICAENGEGIGDEEFGDGERRRRGVVVLIASASMVGGVILPPIGAARAVSMDGVAGSNDNALGESVRRTAARILPNMGPPDVYYPATFQGVWTVRREILTATATAAPPATTSASSSSGADATTSRPVEYRVRYLPATSLDQELVAIADRGYNQANFAAALGDGTKRRVQSYVWSQQNPNDLRIVWSTGLVEDSKVTKRASERTSDTASSSEFVRVVTVEKSGIPVIAARRVMSKYKAVTENRIEGIELEYAVPDPGSIQQPAAPTLLTKSRLVLTRGGAED
jgi:hypothetical protein